MAGEGSELADTIFDIFEGEGMRYDDFMYYFSEIFVLTVQYGGRS